jgi:putative restriction endonuclease
MAYEMFVAVTDLDWYRFLSGQRQLGEVNFWRPSDTPFRALARGGLFCFLLKRPYRKVVGGGFFLQSLTMTPDLAWRTFGPANGAPSRDAFLGLLLRNRSTAASRRLAAITCILLEEVFFFPPEQALPAPANFADNLQWGKRYSLQDPAGQRLWDALAERLAARQPHPDSAQGNLVATATRGRPTLVLPRLGQHGFRTLVSEAYGYRCAVTGERAWPALEAAHIVPVASGGQHLVENGLLLRADLHRLFDGGYLGVDPDDRRLLVSRRLREEFHNGHAYYALHGRPLNQPAPGFPKPSCAFLEYHRQQVFLG